MAGRARPSADSMQTKRHLVAAVLLAAVCLAYVNHFDNSFHFDDFHANGAHRRIVHIARVLGDNYFVFRKAGQVGNAHVQIRVATCNTRGGCMRQPRRTSGRHHAPFCLREFPKTFADGVHQFVKLNVML